MFDSLGSLMFGHSSSQQFRLQLRCFSAPFFERADSKKINDVNHGGKVGLIVFSFINLSMFILTNLTNLSMYIPIFFLSALTISPLSKLYF